MTPYYCSGSLKTHESEFYFSGLPNFGYQGCHISEGAGRIIFQLILFNAVEPKNMVELFKCFGNPMRELLQSRHFVLLAYIRFSHNRLRYISENRTRLLSIQTGLSFITTNLHHRKRDLTTSYQQCMYGGLCLKKKAKNPQKQENWPLHFGQKRTKFPEFLQINYPKPNILKCYRS